MKLLQPNLINRVRRAPRLAPLAVMALVLSACTSVTLVEDINPGDSNPSRFVDFAGSGVWFVTSDGSIHQYDKSDGDVEVLLPSETISGGQRAVVSDILRYSVDSPFSPLGSWGGVWIESVDGVESLMVFSFLVDLQNPFLPGGPAHRLDAGGPIQINDEFWFPGFANSTPSLGRVAELGSPVYFPTDGRITEFAKPAVAGPSSPYFLGESDSSGFSEALYEFDPNTGAVTMLTPPAQFMKSLVEVQGSHSLAVITDESGAATLTLINPDDPSDRFGIADANGSTEMTVVGDMLWFIGEDGDIHGFNTVVQDTEVIVQLSGSGQATSIGHGHIDGQPVIYFGADDAGGEGNELWSFNPGSPGVCGGGFFCQANPVADINPGAGGSFPDDFFGFDNTLLMSATRNDVGRELFILEH